MCVCVLAGKRQGVMASSLGEWRLQPSDRWGSFCSNTESQKGQVRVTTIKAVATVARLRKRGVGFNFFFIHKWPIKMRLEWMKHYNKLQAIYDCDTDSTLFEPYQNQDCYNHMLMRWLQWPCTVTTHECVISSWYQESRTGVLDLYGLLYKKEKWCWDRKRWYDFISLWFMMQSNVLRSLGHTRVIWCTKTALYFQVNSSNMKFQGMQLSRITVIVWSNMLGPKASEKSVADLKNNNPKTTDLRKHLIDVLTTMQVV